jgi:ComF family protein
VCQAPPLESPLCATCESELATLPDAVCSNCRLFVNARQVCPLGHTDLVVHALGLFDSHYRALLHAFKFHDDLSAGRWLGQRLGRMLTRRGTLTVEAVVPVPLHRVRQRERGFNQSEVIGHEVARALGVPLIQPVARRANTRTQSLLPREERLVNVRGAFEVTRGLQNMPVLLVDDVITTGATLEACAESLRAGGSGPIVGAAVALAEP